MTTMVRSNDLDGAERVATGEVPTIDIGPFLRGDPTGRQTVVAEVRRACEEIGFFTIVGHGVPDALVERIRDVSNRFFDLPLGEKLKVQCGSEPASPGYTAMGEKVLARSLGKASPPDYQEAFKIGTLNVPADDPYYNSESARRFFVPNLWPEQPPELRAIYSEYYAVMERLAADLMRIFALALDLEETFFEDKMDKAVNVLRSIRYPAQTDEPKEGQLRAGAHTDYGTVTILLAENKPGGLQVRRRDGQWVDVRPVPGAYVINIGDLMMHWTNDHWISNLHRVVNPPREFSTVARTSVVFFQKPNYDAEIRCIDKYAGAASAPKYEPTTAGAHWYNKNAKSRLTAKASAS